MGGGQNKSYGQVEAIRVLLAAGAHINHVNADGLTALLYHLGSVRNCDHPVSRAETWAHRRQGTGRLNSRGSESLSISCRKQRADTNKFTSVRT